MRPGWAQALSAAAIRGMAEEIHASRRIQAREGGIPCAGPDCAKPAVVGKRWARFCSSHCRAAAWDAANPRQKRAQLQLALDPAPQAERTAALRSFHARALNVPATEAKAAEARCKGQERRLLAWWRDNPTARLSRYTAAEVLGLTPSSGGRALSNLRDAGYLRKRMDIRIEGPCGATVHPYELADA